MPLREALVLRSRSKPASAVLLASTALSSVVAGAVLPACSQVVSVGADPVSLEFAGSDFDGSGPVTRTTTICYTGPGQADCTAEVPPPFSLASGDGSTTEQFSITEGACHDLVVALAEPADLDERLAISVVGELISGTVGVALLATAQGGSGDAGATDGGSGDGGGDGGSGTDGGSDGGTETDGGVADGGSTDGGGTGDGGGDSSPCPAYSGLATTRVRTYQTADTYTALSGLTGTQTVTIDASDPDAPVLVAVFSLTDSSGSAIETTERQGYTCDSTGSTLVWSETEGSLVATDGTTFEIARIDTYSDGMRTMVPDYGSGPNVADTFTLEREEDGRTTTISGSNVVTAGGASTTATDAGSFLTIQSRIIYAAASDTQDYYAYLHDELGVVKSFYWDLVSVE